jgi:hypothetical protein
MGEVGENQGAQKQFNLTAMCYLYLSERGLVNPFANDLFGRTNDFGPTKHLIQHRERKTRAIHEITQKQHEKRGPGSG